MAANLSNEPGPPQWFVADGEVIFPATGGVLPVLTNAELEIIEQFPLGGGTPGTAFRIDNLGNNQPLLGESLTADLVFEPSETWTFVVQDWAALAGITGGCGSSVGTVSFGSLGVGGISCNSIGSNASIIARQVPEPAAPALFVLGLAAFAALRRTPRRPTSSPRRRHAAGVTWKPGVEREIPTSSSVMSTGMSAKSGVLR